MELFARFLISFSVCAPVLYLPQAVAQSGSAANPVVTFDSDTDTGLFSPANGNWAVTTGGTERLRIDSSGKVGIGTTSTGATLDVNGSGLFSGSMGSREVTFIVGAGTTYPASGGIDMRSGNVFTLNASAAGACPTAKLDFATMTAGLTYTISFVGYDSGTCAIQDQAGSATNVKFFGGSAPTITSAQHVVCSAVRVGSYLYLSCLRF